MMNAKEKLIKWITDNLGKLSYRQLDLLIITMTVYLEYNEENSA